MCFPPEPVPGDLRLHKDTESLSLGDEVETGSTIIQQKTCSYVSPLLDVILRRRGRKNSAAPGMYSLLDYFTQQILRRRSGIPVRLQLMQTLTPAPPPTPHPIRDGISFLQHLLHLFSILDAAISFP